MPLAGEEYRVTRPGLGQRSCDRIAAVGNQVHRLRRCASLERRLLQLPKYLLDGLAAVVLLREVEQVSSPCRRAAKGPALAGIALAGRADDEDDAAGRAGPQHLQDLLQGRPGMGEVDDDLERAGLDQLHPAGNAREVPQAPGQLCQTRATPLREQEAGGGKCGEHVIDVELAHQWRLDRDPLVLPENLEAEPGLLLLHSNRAHLCLLAKTVADHATRSGPPECLVLRI